MPLLKSGITKLTLGSAKVLEFYLGHRLQVQTFGHRETHFLGDNGSFTLSHLLLSRTSICHGV